jgi:superfamily II DNA or RNA helicase
MADHLDELPRLREENERLKALLDRHGIDWGGETPSMHPTEATRSVASAFTTEEKVALFRDLFQGRTEVYARRWESARGKAGYVPACANEWQEGVCGKPRTKCSECAQRQLLPLTDRVIFDHLSGRYVVGVYPLLDGDMCRFLAADFDEGEWKEDATAFAGACRANSVPCAIEVSRSGKGAHVWMFFDSPIPAIEARRLGAAMISQTCASRRQLELSSYDRFFPNQDRLPSGGFGNLIALPLQKKAREKGGSVFVDEYFKPFPDQWAYLASLPKMTPAAVKEVIARSTNGGDPLDLAFCYESDDEPWKKNPSPSGILPGILPGPLPDRLEIVIADRIYLKKENLSQALLNRIIRLAAFSNPEFYRTQAMRLPVWDKPRIIGCAENYPKHIALPRGCREELSKLLSDNGIAEEVKDERSSGRRIEATFLGSLRPEQSGALDTLAQYDIGVLKAPTAFGKTVVAAAVIAARKTSTLVLVHRAELLRQWKERLGQFLSLEGDGIGMIGGGKKKPKGLVDIAVMQSLSRREDLPTFLAAYGQIIVDECHHISALSFEAILKQAPCRWVLGLTATPIRRDGLDPIIFMQCGPIRYSAATAIDHPGAMEVRARLIHGTPSPADMGIQAAFGLLAADEARNSLILHDIEESWRERRKVLVLTGRTDHLEGLAARIAQIVPRPFVLHGRMTRKDRNAVLAELEALPDEEPRVILATGKLVGEGFDHPSLDTLVLAMPISWKGTLVQYAGRLNRACAGKRDLRIYDYVEIDDPRLNRMWTKRERGYRALGYEIRRIE